MSETLLDLVKEAHSEVLWAYEAGGPSKGVRDVVRHLVEPDGGCLILWNTIERIAKMCDGYVFYDDIAAVIREEMGL